MTPEQLERKRAYQREYNRRRRSNQEFRARENELRRIRRAQSSTLATALKARALAASGDYWTELLRSDYKLPEYQAKNRNNIRKMTPSQIIKDELTPSTSREVIEGFSSKQVPNVILSAHNPPLTDDPKVRQYQVAMSAFNEDMSQYPKYSVPWEYLNYAKALVELSYRSGRDALTKKEWDFIRYVLSEYGVNTFNEDGVSSFAEFYGY